jgi:hypothetical protein
MNELEEKDRVSFISILLDKQFYFIEPDLSKLSPMVKFAYISVKHSVDTQIKGYESLMKKKAKKTEPEIDPAPGGGADPEEQYIIHNTQYIIDNNIIDNNIIDNNIIDNIENKKYNFKKEMINYGFEKELIEDWLEVRKKKKAANTQTALNGFLNEIEKSNLDKNDVLRLCVEKNWIGFKASWEHGLKPKQDLQPKKIRQQDYYSYEEYLYDCKKFNVTPEPQL